MKKKPTSIWQKISLWLFFGLLAYMPLHILLSTWLGTSFGVLGFAKVAKELVLLGGAGLALVIGLRRGIVRQLLRDKLIWLLVAFTLLNVGLALWRPTDPDAELLGLAYNVRFLVYFVWAVILTKLYSPQVPLARRAVKIVLIVGLVTVMFGLLQYLVIPDDALQHLGYARENGVLPAFFIDDKPDLERIMSTVRDPNSYGSYLIILLSLLGSRILLAKRPRHIDWLYLLAAGLALFWTFSRSAWLGALAAAAVLVFFVVRSRREQLARYKRPLLGAGIALVVLAFSSLAVFWNSYWVQNVVFHADEATVLEDPNELRMRFWQESLAEVADNPVGGGPGTAGLASIRNDERTVLNENYYLQMAQETGIAGLLLFLAILAIIALRLHKQAVSGDWLATALLASLAGLMLTNFLVHIWANEAVAYTWWGLAGLAVGRAGKEKKK